MGIYEATWEACKRWYGRCHKPHCITRQGLWLMLTGLPPNFQWTWLESLHSMDSLNQLDSWDVFSLAYPQKGDLFSTNKRCFVLGVSMGDAVSIGDQIHHQVPLPLQGWCELRRLGESCSILPRAPSINIHLPSQGRRKCASLRTFVQSMIFDPGSKEIHVPKSTPSNDVGTDLHSCPPHSHMGLENLRAAHIIPRVHCLHAHSSLGLLNAITSHSWGSHAGLNTPGPWYQNLLVKKERCVCQ